MYLRIFPGKGRATEIAVARANSVKLAAYSTNQHINNYYVRHVRFVAFQWSVVSGQWSVVGVKRIVKSVKFAFLGNPTIVLTAL